MAKKNVNQKAYKMLQLYAKDIYNYTRFNEKCKMNGKVQTPYAIDVNPPNAPKIALTIDMHINCQRSI